MGERLPARWMAGGSDGDGNDGKVERMRNNSGDRKTDRFKWIEQDWSKNPQIRQLIVRASNPEGNILRDRESQGKERGRMQQIKRLEEIEKPTPPQRQKLGRYRAGQKSAQRNRKKRNGKKRNAKIQILQEKIDELDKQLLEAEEVSRLDTLIRREAVRLCGEKKYLMDVIKITARNLFYDEQPLTEMKFQLGHAEVFHCYIQKLWISM